MSHIRILRVLTLPPQPLANSFYYVKNGNVADAYMTDGNSQVYPITNSDILVQMIGELSSGGPVDPGDTTVYFENALL